MTKEKGISPLVSRLLDARRQVQISNAEALEKTSYTGAQCLMLWAVHANPGTSQTRLVQMTGIDRSTLADVVRRLIRDGLLRRKRTKEDQRAYAVQLTPKGKQAYDTISSAK